ncbi:MAG: uracil-DNA glycosylase [Treponema sp.]|nr:uracil-DNA glycosylase [Treponema sp.]
MTKEDKQTIYNLLKTASRNVYGYTTPAFESDEYVENVPAQVQPSVSTQSSAPAATQFSAPAAPETSSAPETSGMSLGDVILKIARCTRCSLARSRTNVVPGQGSKSAEVLVIGDGPVMEDDASGVPFSGAAGQLMDKMLNAVKLDRRQNCFLTNIVKCTPPQNRDPYPEETDACFGFIEAQIKIIKPKLILCAGRVAAVTLLKSNPNVNLSLPVDQIRGQWFDYNGIPVMVVYSPAEVLKNPALKKPIWDDLRAFATKLKELSPTYAALFNS